MDKTKEKILASLENTYCRLKPSEVSGVGVYAIRDIPSGTVLVQGQRHDEWFSFTTEELAHLDEEVLNMIEDFFVEENGVVRIPESGLDGMDMSFYVNHSENPNATTYDDGFTFTSTRDIKKGEEITVSYGVYDQTYRIND